MENLNAPLVSIIIPVYNGSNYLKEAIESALNQTYSNIEILVINDGSNDNGKTEKIALSFGNKIRYFSKDNGGVSTALNYGISQMKGEWFSWLSHDDIYFPQKIEYQINALKNSNTSCDIVRCNTKSVDAYGNEIFRPKKKIDGELSGEEMLKAHLLKEVGLYGCSLLISKRVFDDVGGFDTELRLMQDEDLWIRIMFADYRFISISDELVNIRVHKGQTTNRLLDKFDEERNIYSNKVINYFNNNKKNNYNKLVIFLCNQGKEGRYGLQKYIVSKVKRTCRITILDRIKIYNYNIYGLVYSTLKNIYRKTKLKKIRS